MNEHETHDAVIKLARRELENHERINCWFRPEFVRALIDRLEATHKRERGDCAKLREAAKDVARQLRAWAAQIDPYSKDGAAPQRLRALAAKLEGGAK